MQPPPEPNPFVERWLARLEETLHDRSNPEGAFQKFFRAFRKTLTITTIGYVALLLSLLLLLGWWGERHWILSVLLFVPATLWLAPLMALAPLQLIFRRSLLSFSAFAVAVVALVYLDLNWTFLVEEQESQLKLVTANIGQRDFQKLEEFLAEENPDVIALQDAWGMARVLRQKHPDQSIVSLDEYVLWSKYPVRKSGLLRQLMHQGHPIGAWHEVDFKGQTIVVYNIHMPTPRPEFLRLLGPGFVNGALRNEGMFSAKNRKNYAQFVERRIELARGLVEILQNEKRPFIVVGDFNMPANGYIWDLFRSEFTDVFGIKGRGYGFTFPSTSKNPMSFFGPWLRLDYVFTGKDWQPVFCRVEPRAPGQHRAVVCGVKIQKKK